MSGTPGAPASAGLARPERPKRQLGRTRCRLTAPVARRRPAGRLLLLGTAMHRLDSSALGLAILSVLSASHSSHLCSLLAVEHVEEDGKAMLYLVRAMRCARDLSLTALGAGV